MNKISYKVWFAFWTTGILLCITDMFYSNIILLITSCVMIFVSLGISMVNIFSNRKDETKEQE